MKVLGNLSGGVMNNLNNCMLCRVEKYDVAKMKAELTPMLRVEGVEGELEELHLLIEVPVMLLKAGPFVIRPPYKQGDIVVVVFADGDIENILLSGDVSNPNSKRRHSLDDAIVIGGLMPFTEDLPSGNSNDLVIGKDDFSSSIIFKENGDIDITASGNINIKGQRINLN